MKKSRKSYNDQTNQGNVTVHMPVEAKQQLLFLCELHHITPSALCRKVLMAFLNKQNVTKKMIEYALKQIALEGKE